MSVAQCAHLVVRLNAATSDGITRSRWQCRDCRIEFSVAASPLEPVCPPTLLDECRDWYSSVDDTHETQAKIDRVRDLARAIPPEPTAGVAAELAQRLLARLRHWLEVEGRLNIGSVIWRDDTAPLLRDCLARITELDAEREQTLPGPPAGEAAELLNDMRCEAAYVGRGVTLPVKLYERVKAYLQERVRDPAFAARSTAPSATQPSDGSPPTGRISLREARERVLQQVRESDERLAAERAADATAAEGVPDEQAAPATEPRIHPCDNCGTMRSKSEGGDTFTVCDACWELLRPPKVPAGQAAPVQPVPIVGAGEVLDTPEKVLETVRNLLIRRYDAYVAAGHTIEVTWAVKGALMELEQLRSRLPAPAASKQDERVECEHEWRTFGVGSTHCRKCGEPSVGRQLAAAPPADPTLRSETEAWRISTLQWRMQNVERGNDLLGRWLAARPPPSAAPARARDTLPEWAQLVLDNLKRAAEQLPHPRPAASIVFTDDGGNEVERWPLTSGSYGATPAASSDEKESRWT